MLVWHPSGTGVRGIGGQRHGMKVSHVHRVHGCIFTFNMRLYRYIQHAFVSLDSNRSCIAMVNLRLYGYVLSAVVSLHSTRSCIVMCNMQLYRYVQITIVSLHSARGCIVQPTVVSLCSTCGV